MILNSKNINKLFLIALCTILSAIQIWGQCTVSKVSTGSSTRNQVPQILGNTIVWRGFDGAIYQIYKSENGGAPQLVSTGSSVDNYFHQI